MTSRSTAAATNKGCHCQVGSRHRKRQRQPHRSRPHRPNCSSTARRPAVGYALTYPASGVAVLVKRDTATGLGTANFAGAGGDALALAVEAGQAAVGVAKAGGAARRTSGEEQDKRGGAGIDSWDGHSS
ncbi:hypothetical protein CS8_032210 [Cupriavidus sp. 8B]